MRLIELHAIARWCGYYSASAELLIAKRLAEGSIGWSEPLKFGIPDASRIYIPAYLRLYPDDPTDARVFEW